MSSHNICNYYTSLTVSLAIASSSLVGTIHTGTLLSFVESRTSSPVRIPRDETMQSALRGLYPCGEGAGYAGGITSAAMDGIRVAEAIASEFAKPEE